MSSTQNSFIKILNSRIKLEERKKKPEINNALENDKKIRLELLSTTKPSLMSTKGFKNEKRKNLVEDMNTFKKIYYKDYMSNKKTLDKIYKLSKENDVFLKHFTGYNKYYENKTQKDILNEIQLLYKKKTGIIPVIQENDNLFKNSVLLQSNKDLKEYISLDLDLIKKDFHSLSFMKNLRKRILNNSLNKNIIGSNINNENINKTEINEKNIKKKKNLKYYNEKYKNENINDLQDDIIKTKESFNSIDNLNYFLNTNAKQYCNYIGNKGERQNSGEASTRMNSAVKGINFFNKDNNIKNNINNFETIKLNKIKNTLYNEYNISNIINNKSRNKFDKKKYNIRTERTEKLKNFNSIILPYINEHNKNNSNKIIKTENKEDINNKKNLRTKTIDYSKLEHPDNKHIKIRDNNQTFNIDEKANSLTKKILKEKHKNIIGLKKHPSPLETLYDKISKSDNSFDYNKDISDYLEKSNYQLKEKKYGNELYSTVDMSRKKISDISDIKKNYDFMMENKLKTYEQNREIMHYTNKIKRNMENIEEKMIGLLCEVNKYDGN